MIFDKNWEVCSQGEGRSQAIIDGNQLNDHKSP